MGFGSWTISDLSSKHYLQQCFLELGLGGEKNTSNTKGGTWNKLHCAQTSEGRNGTTCKKWYTWRKRAAGRSSYELVDFYSELNISCHWRSNTTVNVTFWFLIASFISSTVTLFAVSVSSQLSRCTQSLSDKRSGAPLTPAHCALSRAHRCTPCTQAWGKRATPLPRLVS